MWPYNAANSCATRPLAVSNAAGGNPRHQSIRGLLRGYSAGFYLTVADPQGDRLQFLTTTFPNSREKIHQGNVGSPDALPASVRIK